MKCIQHIRQDESGAAAVEYALLLPILALMMVAIIDFSTFIREQMKLDNLSREAAQYVAQGGKEANVFTAVIQNSPSYKSTDSNKISVQYEGTRYCECESGQSVSCSSGQCSSDDYKRSFFAVTIRGQYKPMFPWPGIPSAVSLRGYSRIQYDG